MKLSELKLNPNNPQKFDDLTSLENSIKNFPKMMKLRPIIYDPETRHVLGGNKRLLCLQNLGYKEIPDDWVKSADELTEDEKKRFVIQDNIQIGKWDFYLLDNWDSNKLVEWGLDLSDISGIDYGNKNINDIEEVSSFNESVNFVIKCDSIEQLEQLQKKINISGKQISYKDFLIKAGL